MHPHNSHHQNHLAHNLTGFFRVSFALLLLTAYCLLPTVVFASDNFIVTPVVIDGKGKQREIMRFTTTVTNTTKHLVSVYPWVTDVDPSLGATGVSDLAGTQGEDISLSLARWIEVTRGVIDLLPGEHKEIPIMVQIHLNAKPGTYHAVIHLSEGSNRATAEANKAGTSDVLVNIEVLEDINERLQLGTFTPVKNFFTGDSATFNYRIENIGNRGIVPHGKIRIYDGRGEEVATVDANQDNKRFEPSAKEMVASVWSSGDHFGRYKAMLDLEYGARGTLQDTVFFWVMPWKKMAGMFTMLMVLCVIIAVTLHSHSVSRRGGAFAPVRARGGEQRGMFARFRGEEEDEEAEEVESPVNELHEIDIPSPVHTRLHARVSAHSATPSTRLTRRESATVSGNQVQLVHRERPKPSPEHIVNLKK